MPSKESQIISDAYTVIAERQKARPDMSLDETRTTFQDLQLCSTEPTNVTYEDVDAGGVPALLVKPLQTDGTRMILYLHGGGFVLMGPATHRKLVGHLAKAANAQALIIDYRLAPDNIFPAQLEDAVTAYRWLLDRGVKPGHLATAGDSAGGNLAISTVLKLRDDGIPLPGAIVAFSPWIDMEWKSESLQRNSATDKLVQQALLQQMADSVLGGKTQPNNPLANPLRSDPKGLPPIYINAGTAETLQDDSVRFAELAEKAGVDVTLDLTEGMQHVHVFMAGRAPEADSVISDVGKFLKGKLGKEVNGGLAGAA